MAPFPPGKGGGDGVAKGFKGKGVLIHCLVDARGLPLQVVVTAANASERAQVMPMLESLRCSTGSVGTGRFRPAQIAADKGYDAKWLREALRGVGIRPEIPKRVFRTRRQPPGATAGRSRRERVYDERQYQDRIYDNRECYHKERIIFCYIVCLLNCVLCLLHYIICLFYSLICLSH